MSYLYLPNQPFNPAAARTRVIPRPLGWTPLDDYGQMEGLGKFLKKAAKVVTKVARAPIKLVAPKLEKKLEKLDNKIIDNVDSLHTKVNVAAKKAAKDVGKFVKKNWKWIVIAGAIALTIYSMGSGSTIAAKMMSGLAKVKGYATSAKAWAGGKLSSGWSYVTSGMTKLLNGKKFGELSPQEVEALAEANQQSGESLVPPEILAMLGQQSLDPGVTPAASSPNYMATSFPGPSSGGGGSAGNSPSETPAWLMPALIGGGALLLVMAIS